MRCDGRVVNGDQWSAFVCQLGEESEHIKWYHAKRGLGGSARKSSNNPRLELLRVDGGQAMGGGPGF